MRADVSESDGIGLVLASSHAEDLTAVRVVEEVLVLAGVGHQEGEGVAFCVLHRIVAPLIDTVVSVGFGELEPAPGLAVGVNRDPAFVVGI